MTVRFGLIGCGFISKNHLKALSRCEQARLVAISDIQKERMVDAVHYYQSKLGSVEQVDYYEDYERMLEDTRVDVVIIATISGFHFEMAKKALLAGKHVIIEKPIALSIDEADHLIRMAKEKNKKMMVCHQLRYRPLMQKIKRVIVEGKIGKPYLGVASIRINRSSDYYKSAAWRGSWETDGGMLINQGIHLVDLLQWFLGNAQSVYGEIANHSFLKETEDVALGVIQFKNDAKGIVEANIITQPNNLGYSLTIFGKKGTISVEGPSLDIISRWHVEGEKTNQIEILEDKNEQLYMYEDFIKGIKNDEHNILIDGVEGKKALEIIFAIYYSALTKTRVGLPMKSFSTAEMKRKEEKYDVF